MTAQEINRIVREVIHRLSAMPCSQSPAPSSTLHIHDRVVSLVTLEGQLDGIVRLVVPERAVVTPAVMDELRQENIRLVRSTGPQHQNSTKLIVGNTTARDMQHLLAELPCEISNLNCRSLNDAVTAMANQLTGAALGLIRTAEPETAACIANRHHTLRAVCGHHESSVKRAVQSMAANVLVLGSESSNDQNEHKLLRMFLNTPRQQSRALGF